jgi:glutaredoxin/glutathione-dependent peroxiredoxin
MATIGAQLPDATFSTKTGDGVQAMTVDQIFSGRKVVLVGLPGAFTPTCSMNHAPGFVKLAAEIKAKGVDMIAITSVNDVHVMAAWAKQLDADGKVVLLADGNGDFARAAGLEFDLTMAGMGKRSKRYSMIVDNKVIRVINVEDKPGVNVSGAETILEQL